MAVMEQKATPTAAQLVVLVHGTFARDAAWAQEGSLLRHQITESRTQHPVRFFRFRWSGRNTNAARLRAGQNLSRFIQRLSRANGNSRIVLVGHSHGGNVILYALRDPATSGMVERVVTFGTPFLHVSRRKVELAVPAFTQSVPFLTFAGAGAFLYSDVVFGSHAQYFHTLFLLAVAASLLFMYMNDFLSETIVSALRKRHAAASRELSVTAPRDVPLLAATSRKDEVAVGLGFLDRIGDAPFIAVARAAALANILFCAFAIFAGIVRFAEAFTGPWDESTSESLLYIIVPLVVLIGGFTAAHILLIVVPLIRITGYFDFSIAHYIHTRVCIRAAPPVLPDNNLVIVAEYDLSSSARRSSVLDHCNLYGDLDVLSDVTQWMTTGHEPSFGRVLACANAC